MRRSSHALRLVAPILRGRLTLALALLAIGAPASHATDAPRSAPLLEFIRNAVDPATGRLRPEALTLPDEPAVRRYSRFRTEPGAVDGTGTHHVQWDASGKSRVVADLLGGIGRREPKAAQALTDLLRIDDVVTFHSSAIESAVLEYPDAGAALHDYALQLVTTGTERGQVKFGLALLGATGDPNDLPLVRMLALHDEFGLYAAEALQQLAPEPQRELYEMARRVTGWGRIQAVEKMAAVSDSTMRRWLLTEGYRNTVMPQYLAWQCATIGDLRGALAAPRPDPAVLAGAAEILQALVAGGPARGMDDYADAPEAALRYLRRTARVTSTVTHFLAAQALLDYLDRLQGSTAGDPRFDSAATQDARRRWAGEPARSIRKLAWAVVANPQWPDKVRHALAAGPPGALGAARAAALRLGIDIYESQYAGLTREPSSPERWSMAFEAAGPTRIAPLVALAERTLVDANPPLPPAARAVAVRAVAAGLARYPGMGVRFLLSALSSDQVDVRRAAVDCLARWGSPWLASEGTLRDGVRSAMQAEKDDAMRARMIALLNLN